MTNHGDGSVDDDRRDSTSPEEETAPNAGEAEPSAQGLPPSEPPAGDSFGFWLRQQRELREIELREIADRTKISIRYLKAMEQSRFDVLPGPIFAKGFLREYAKYVGLNPDEVVNYYLATQQESGDEPEEEAAERPGRGWGKGLVLALTAVGVLALLSFFLFSYLERRSAQRSPAPPPITAPMVPAPEPAPPPPSSEADEERSPLEVTIDFVQDCWLEAQIDDGRRVAQLFAQGESQQFSAEERVVLVSVGKARGIEVQVNGHPYDPGGREGETLRNVVIDLELAERLAQEEP